MRGLISLVLFNTCKQATAKQASREDGRNEEDYKLGIKAFEKLKTVGWGESDCCKLVQAIGIVSKNKTLESFNVLQSSFELFSCVKNEKTKCIITHSDKRYYINSKGVVDIIPNSKMETCSEEEIKQLIAELTDKQWQYIMTDPLFTPLINEALDSPVSVIEKTNKSEEANNEKVNS